jgi:prepilin-type N-terminal cleavage/methylation domain-containing protein
MKKHCELISGENREKGFTLVELLIALVIFSVGIVGAARMHVAAINGNMYSMQLTNAVNVAETQAERLQDIDFTEGQVTDGLQGADLLETTSGRNQYTGQSQTYLNVSYTPSWTVSRVENNPKLLLVRMTVTWNEKETPKAYNMNFYTGIN